MAVTRARRQLVVICDSRTVRNHDFLRCLVDYMSEHGEVRTAFEYLEDLVPENYHHEFKDKQNNINASSTKTKTRNQGKKGETKVYESKITGRVQSKDDAQFSSNLKSDLPKPKADDQIKKEEMRQQLLIFLDNQSQSELQFTPSLNSHERLLVHQLCEEMELKHVSKGTGKQRHITVSKSVAEPEERLEEESESTRPEIQIPEQVMETEYNRQPLKPALDLKSLHLERMRREQEKREEKIRSKRLEDSKGPSTKKNKGVTKGTVAYILIACSIGKLTSLGFLPFDYTWYVLHVKVENMCIFVKKVN